MFRCQFIFFVVDCIKWRSKHFNIHTHIEREGWRCTVSLKTFFPENICCDTTVTASTNCFCVFVYLSGTVTSYIHSSLHKDKAIDLLFKLDYITLTFSVAFSQFISDVFIFIAYRHTYMRKIVFLSSYI